MARSAGRWVVVLAVALALSWATAVKESRAAESGDLLRAQTSRPCPALLVASGPGSESEIVDVIPDTPKVPPPAKGPSEVMPPGKPPLTADDILENVRPKYSPPPDEVMPSRFSPPTYRSPTVDASRLAEKRCSAKELEELFDELSDTGRLLLGLMASQGGDGAPKGGGEPPPPLPDFDASYGRLLGELCAKLKGAKPRGLGGMLPGGGMGPRGCAFARFMQGLSGPGGDMGQRALACIQKHSQQGPPPVEATQVRYPTEKCGRGKPGKMSEINKVKMNLYDLLAVRASDAMKRSKGVKREFWSRIGGALTLASLDLEKGGEGKLGFKTTKLEGGGRLYEFDRDKGKVLYVVQGGKVTKITAGKVKVEGPNEGKDKQWAGKQSGEEPEEQEAGGTGRPVEPGEGGCGDTPSMKQAKAIFDCIFSGPSQVSPGGTPEPVSRPAGPSGTPLPKDCNEVNVASIWGSSTSPRGGATDPENPEDLMSAGPKIPKEFIPKIHGVIDPPKGSVALPGGKDIPGDGQPGSEDPPKGKGDD